MEDKINHETFSLVGTAEHIVTASERITEPRINFDALIEDVAPETKLAVCAWLMQKLVDHAREGGTFRSLVYGRLGFGFGAWMTLYLAGGMDISHNLNFHEASAADECVRTDIANAASRITDIEQRDKLIEAMFRFEQLAEAASAWTVVIKKQRLDITAQTEYVAHLTSALRSASTLVGLLGKHLAEISGNADLGELIDAQLRLYEQSIDLVQSPT